MNDQVKQQAGARKYIPFSEAAGNPHRARYNWLSSCAYFIAEARGFAPEGAMEDWLQAERAYTEQSLAKGESD